MAKTLIAFYSRRGQNWVDGSIRNLPKGNNEVIVEKIKALIPDADVFRIDTVKKYSDDYMVKVKCFLTCKMCGNQRELLPLIEVGASNYHRFTI